MTEAFSRTAEDAECVEIYSEVYLSALSETSASSALSAVHLCRGMGMLPMGDSLFILARLFAALWRGYPRTRVSTPPSATGCEKF